MENGDYIPMLLWHLCGALCMTIAGYLSVLVYRRWIRPTALLVVRRRNPRPASTPRGIDFDDCMLGSLTILTHVLDQRTVRAVAPAYTHHRAQGLLTSAGFSPRWGTFINGVYESVSTDMWLRLADSLGITGAVRRSYGDNPLLAGTGMLYMDRAAGAHAVVYQDGRISHPSRTADAPTWERLRDVCDRYSMTPRTLIHVAD